ncbi:MAG: 16S rRNA methyltransferase [Chloroflexi bacterium]|nr:16S rRNA methyltransferase [Chloroflexota bacterium]
MARARARARIGDAIPVEEVVRRVVASRRYGSVDAALIRRLALNEIPKARNLADAEKRTKRRLHQIFGAYCAGTTSAGGRRGDDVARFQTVSADLADPGLRALCRDLLGRHASSRERVDVLDRFYTRIFAVSGLPSTVVDLGCGLNPLALPWMGLPAGARYLAYDIDKEQMALVDTFLTHVGVEHVAEVRDVLANPPAEPADAAFLLKTLPCLEHQEAGAGARLLRAVEARHVVVSYPTRSLGGRVNKGMARTYRDQLHAIIAGESWTVQEIEFENELVFIIEKGFHDAELAG